MYTRIAPLVRLDRTAVLSFFCGEPERAQRGPEGPRRPLTLTLNPNPSSNSNPNPNPNPTPNPQQVLRPTRGEAASLHVQSRGRVKVAAAGETLSVQFKNLCVG